ncbi:Adenylate and Guanylate cyclase catalytic domain containing protein [Tritrichomonas foetus]|uniref:Adenylate and Guanylate cyclase catalytic domain containing protein n=1 Tax=Tritrichomonas foetus TaxID=1144522 RepID=A0A1J4KAG2_9EUKA|nr:Adenylate and Guanylate cyclase catalytic domain containing protein [Tritrichomonas foetus]|eukprot:OHT06654.1 Adenylate and Guanylate cyclase catalytic domain containing protein [Tritrichomonas foetus]
MKSFSHGSHSNLSELGSVGVVEPNILKKLRNSIFFLFIHIDTINANYFPIHIMISIWRIVQFVGPAFAAPFPRFWEPNSPYSTAISIISIFFHIVPQQYRDKSTIIVEFTFVGIMILCCFVLFISSYMLRKNAKVSSIIPPFIIIFVNGFLHLLPPIVLEFIGESIGNLIYGRNNFNRDVEIVGIVLSLIFVLVYFWFLWNIGTVSFVIRPYSLLTITRNSQCYFSFLVSTITFVSALCSHLTFYLRVVLTFVCALMYLIAVKITFMNGSFISDLYKNLIISASISSALFLMLVAIYDIIDRQAVMTELFIFIFLFVIFYFISIIITKKYIRNTLLYLDQNGEEIDRIEKFDQYLKCAIIGFIYSHPSINGWQFFKNGTEKWPDKLELWILFGKFVAIYPDEGSLLSYIIHSIQAKKFHNLIARQIIYQAQAILNQREGSLSIDLKIRLAKSSRQVQFTKRKIRHVWDLAIQSNLIEIDSAINTAYNSVNKARSNFNHLFSQYPNNRFVARAYSRFLLEVEGDHQQYNEWCDKIRKLQRGILVSSDRTNVLGIHAFPILPVISPSPNLKALNDSDSNFNDGQSEMDDSNIIAINEQLSIIQDKIKDLSIPALNCIRIWMSILYFGLVLLPAVAVLAYAPIYLQNLTGPLEYMKHISFLRNAAFQMPLLELHYLFENIPKPDNLSLPFFFQPKYPDSNMTSYGGYKNTYDQLKYIITQASNSVEYISNFRNWSPDDFRVDQAHKIIFDSYIPYTYYTLNYSYTKNTSLQGAIMEESLQILEFLKLTPSIELLNTSYIVNPSINTDIIVTSASYALQVLNDYLSQDHQDINNLMLFIMMFLCIVYVVIIIGILVFMIDNLNRAKLDIFQCLTTIPKNVVSNVAESLKLISKTDDSDSSSDNMNKQDENIMKVFSSVSDISGTKSSEKLIYIFLNAFFLLCTIGTIVLICELFPSVSQELRQNAPHLDYVLGSASYLFGSLHSLNVLIAELNDFIIPLHDPNIAASRSLNRLDHFSIYFHRFRYGNSGDGNDTPPFDGFQKAYDSASSHFYCTNETHIPTKFVEYYNCFSIDIQINLLEPFVSNVVSPYYYNSTNHIDSHDPHIDSLWSISMKLYDTFYFPMFDRIVDDMKNMLSSTIPNLRTPTIVLLIINFMIILFIYYQTYISSEKIKFALSLLLQCPPNIVMQTAKVMDILGGDFGSEAHEGQTRHREFFDAIVESIPDSVIVLNDKYEIESMNRSSERIYGIKRNDMIGQNAKDFFCSNKFSENAAEIFNFTDLTKINVVYEQNEGDNSYFELNFMVSGSHYAIITSDQTQTYSYKRLISDEKEKSDKLLASILPSNLITRVQNGEENISFSVQSATILFLDIVEFTPWCAANTAQMIMSTLNIMFREFDSQVLTHSTMTKIKCIGDCYMAAGGIFVEVNQPAVHAKEVVEFGLEAIHGINLINKEFNLNLRIRVGINTGGPIVAGVIGTNKPTFEILGPPINMAQQMEHHGVPMVVHISRSTYQLIYGGSFNVRERGKIEIKNGVVSTYLVFPKGTK